MILVSGCLTMSIDSKVNKSGGVEKYNITMDTTSYVYSMLNENKPLRQEIVSQGGQYKEVWDGNNVRILINGITPQNVSTEKNDSYLIYRDRIGFLSPNKENADNMDKTDIDKSMDKAMDKAIQIHYYLEMPNKIIDSNADYVEENKAEWHMLNSSSIRDVYAKCETPSSPLPAVGVFSSLSIILITTLILQNKRGKL